MASAGENAGGAVSTGHRGNRQGRGPSGEAGDQPAERDSGVQDGGVLGALVGDRLRVLWGSNRWLDLVSLLVGLPLAWMFRFAQDDAFISLRYARNLADGHGLVFNVGDRVEGYTNFLWTWLLSIPFRMDWDPLLFAHVLGLVCFAATLLALRRIATEVFGSGPLPAVSMAVFLTSHTVLVYGTGGGLETQLQTALLAWATLVTLRLRRQGELDDPEPGDPEGDRRVVVHCLVLSVLAGAALLTRLDSAVPLAVLAVLALIALKRRSTGGIPVAALVALALPVAAIVTPWLIWKLDYYGALLPNTFTAKSTPLPLALARAAIFLAVYLVVTFQLFLFPVVVAYRRALGATAELRVLRLLVGIWLVYLAIVGADFMEFRFLVVALPAAAVLFTAVLNALRSRALLLFCVAVIVLGAPIKWRLMPPAIIGIESATGLEQHGVAPAGWKALGEELAEVFPGGEDSGVTIAVTPAGYIPFYSRLPTVDMLGLNDPGVLEEPCELTWLKAGHEQIATPEHLRGRADLVLGAGLAEDVDPDRTAYGMDEVEDIFLRCSLDRDDLPAGSVMVEIPLGDDRIVPAIVLERAEEVLAVAEERGWKVYPIEA